MTAGPGKRELRILSARRESLRCLEELEKTSLMYVGGVYGVCIKEECFGIQTGDDESRASSTVTWYNTQPPCRYCYTH